ncbi:protein MONOCULM 1-like [Oryza brachyantha]|uniref:protein MONOCULM 1-like n=1 Tax=Oryza brachyantha TaxID=4533 RepID=UPI001ADC3F3F|nr:protein MONOCULM 1-like [Oryza brachyantha]
MNLTLSLGIDGGAGAVAAKKKRKVVGDGGVMHGGDGVERGVRFVTRTRVPQARDRMVKKEADGFDRGDDGGMAAASSDGGGVELVRLLLSAVAAGEVGDVQAAGEALQEVQRRALWPCRAGDPGQRVAACYADALASRLAGLRPSTARSPAAAARDEEFLAYTMYYQASPFYQFAHFTANQAIVEAFESGGRRRLHVVDFDVSYGFQWPSLIQSMSDAASTTTSSSHDDDGRCDGPVSLRITGFGSSADELRETEARLTRFAASCPNLRLEFEGILNGSNSLHERIRLDDDATVVVNLVFPAAQNATNSSREACVATAMAHIHSLSPSMVFLIEKHDGGGDPTGGDNASSASVLPWFAANLRYFAAVFDSLHECLPADSAERLAIERNHLGREIGDAVASLSHHCHGGGTGGGVDHAASWKAALESAGFEDVKLSSRTLSQAKLLLKMKSGCGGGSGGGFRVAEGAAGRAMTLAWRDMGLATATGWRRRRRCR